MAYVYIALVDTPGIFAYAIRKFLKQDYIHAVLSLDEELNEAYSFGRRNPFVPVIAGFEKENKEKILRAFPTARYRICRLECSVEQKNQIRRRLHEDYARRFHMHYAVLSLPYIVRGKSFYLKDQYTCSSYLARVLEEAGIPISGKHFSLVTPKDVYEYPDMEVVFEGNLAELVERERKAMPVFQAAHKAAGFFRAIY